MKAQPHLLGDNELKLSSAGSTTSWSRPGNSEWTVLVLKPEYSEWVSTVCLTALFQTADREVHVIHVKFQDDIVSSSSVISNHGTVKHLTHWPLGNLNEILFRYVIFKQILVTDAWVISYEIALYMSLDLADDQSTLVQVMAWCRQAASHYLSQCWPRSMLPYGVSWPQRVFNNIVWLYHWTNADLFQWKFIRIQMLSFKEANLKMISLKWCPSCSDLNIFTHNVDAIKGHSLQHLQMAFNSLNPGRYRSNFQNVMSEHILSSWAFLVKFLSDECHRAPWMTSQHWFR